MAIYEATRRRRLLSYLAFTLDKCRSKLLYFVLSIKVRMTLPMARRPYGSDETRMIWAIIQYPSNTVNHYIWTTVLPVNGVSRLLWFGSRIIGLLFGQILTVIEIFHSLHLAPI